MTPGDPGAAPAANGVEELYLDLLKRVLTRSDFFPDQSLFVTPPSRSGLLGSALNRLVARAHTLRSTTARAIRLEGRDWPSQAETMLGIARLENIQRCIARVLSDDVPGDLMETGVWRGGSAIFMRAALQAYGDPTRVVWAADSFEGLPPPDPERYPADAGDPHWRAPELAVSLEEVKANFARYGLLDDRVRFCVGWFRDTLPVCPVERLSLLRLDGDMYESTIVALRSLYHKLSVGGFAIVDDYGAVPACRKAVEDFRAEAAITEPVERIDWSGAFWRRER